MSDRVSSIVRWSALAAMCVLIFVFSSFAATDSSQQSSRWVDIIISLFFNGFDEYPAAKQEALVSLLTVIVRKGAHFSEYALLSMLAFSAFRRVKRHSLRWLFAVLFSFVYSCSDEFHQTFVPGRAGLFRDVILDTSGAAFGALAACFLSLMFLARKLLASADDL